MTSLMQAMLAVGTHLSSANWSCTRATPTRIAPAQLVQDLLLFRHSQQGTNVVCLEAGAASESTAEVHPHFGQPAVEASERCSDGLRRNPV